MKFMLLLYVSVTGSVLFAQQADSVNAVSRELKVKVSAFDGIIVAGYVGYGGFLNFTGPNLSFSTENSKFILGMLPSLRFKEDKGETQNSFVTPSLGVGFTYSYKWVAVQVPLYYNPKTIPENGRWSLGIGLGVRINKFRKANPIPKEGKKNRPG